MDVHKLCVDVYKFAVDVHKFSVDVYKKAVDVLWTFTRKLWTFSRKLRTSTAFCTHTALTTTVERKRFITSSPIVYFLSFDWDSVVSLSSPTLYNTNSYLHIYLDPFSSP